MYRHGRWVLVHAGLLPQWSLDEAEALARELEGELMGGGWEDFLGRWRRRPERAGWGDRYDPAPSTYRRRALGLDAFTRVRCIAEDGSMDHEYKGGLASIPEGSAPWYALREQKGETIIFGHWAAHGYARSKRWVSMDSGCVWGEELTALRLEDGAVFKQPAVD